MKYCNYCKCSILNHYLVVDNKIFHPECFCCSACHQPIAGSYVTRQGQPYHRECYQEHFVEKCVICAKPLETYQTDWWGNKYCEHHAKQGDYCDCCNRLICTPITQGGVLYNDGRTVCNICRKSAVDDHKTLNAVYNTVFPFFQNYGFQLEKENIQCQLVGSEQLGGKTRGRINTEIIKEETSNRIISKKVKSISILFGLQLDDAMAVIAHELGHYYLFQNNYPELTRQVEEGFCELFSYLWLSQKNTSMAKYLIYKMNQNDDPIYGMGFRMVKQKFEQFGLTNLVTVLHRTGQLP
ncbi:MAG TPA: protein DA1 [Anaerolineales bacterium]|nr:protein DA1 [Anaerolineales bacterium]